MLVAVSFGLRRKLSLGKKQKRKTPLAGAVHAATLGHGKTIATTYLVGVRGKPIDAVILGIFVTLSHTSGIVVVGVLGSPGSAWLMAGQMEMYLALAVGVLAPTHFQAKPQEC
jgi:ABC-type nickel/cobalt efflux system permease component RcnA